MPPAGPVLVVANHTNGLVDPLLLTAALPRPPRLLGAAWLWRVLPLRPFLALAGVIPVTRAQDAAGGAVDNTSAFARCHAELARGWVIALFPEGVSHSRPHLQPLRTGAARIALEAAERHGAAGLIVLPVGLLFDRKETFRSRALVRVGAPIPVPGGGAQPDAVRELTDRIREGLESVTLNWASWEEARLLSRAAAIWSRPDLEVPQAPELADRQATLRAFEAGFRELRARQPARIAALAGALEEYDARLLALGLRDGQVASRYPVLHVAAYAARSCASLALALPAAGVGIALHWPPYRLCGTLARRLARTADEVATWKLYVALVAFPAWWLSLVALAWRIGGGRAAAVALCLTPALGWIAMRFLELREAAAAEWQAWRLLRARSAAVLDLRRRRSDLSRELAALAADRA